MRNFRDQNCSLGLCACHKILAAKLIVCFCLACALQPFVVVAQDQVVAPVSGQSASELLASGEAAFNAAEWQAAADLFSSFLTGYGELEETQDAAMRVKPLLAICLARLEEYEEALPLIDELLKGEKISEEQRVDLLFFAGLGSFQTGVHEAARGFLGEIFTNPKVERGRRMESLILGGMTYVIEENWAEAVTFFKKYEEEIAEYSPEAGSRANILQLYALMQQEMWLDGVELSKSIFENLDKTRQVVTFSSQLIELGGQLLEQENPHEAISVLRMVPTAENILRMQAARLAEAEAELTVANATGDSVRASQVKTSIAEMERELEAFSGIEQFDSASRLRLAGAYFELERVREGCLILDQMVRQMEPDAIVESATASLIRGWMSLGRYGRSIRTADLYLERFALLEEKPNLADVMFLKAQAFEGQFDHREAAIGYREVADQFPDKPIAAQARFMEAYNILQLERYVQAGELLDAQLEGMSETDEMWQHVIFWRAMAFYFDQKWEKARGLFEQYLAAAKGEGVGKEYIDDSEFRIGYSIFSEARYPEAIKALSEFEKAHPQSEWLAEVLLTLGDSYAAEGELDKADAAFARIAVEAEGFHDEGWMKRGKIFKAKKDIGGMKVLFREFLEKRPNSPRIAEGLHWLGYVARQEGNLEEARKIYLSTIAKYGNDQVRPGLEDVFLGLQELYPADEKPELEALFREKLEQAKFSKKKRLVTRLGWALSKLHLGIKSKPPEQRQKDSRADLVGLADQIDTKETAPQILADVGDALREAGRNDDAFEIYEGLRKWWPRSPFRDRAFAGKAFIELARGNDEKALENFGKFERYAVMPKTAPDERGISLVEGELGGEVAMAKAALMTTQSPEQALDILLAVQKTKSMPANIRADAFLAAGGIHVEKGRFREAIPYFEQVYLLFNRYPEKVAKAYHERGKALERMGMNEKAREVYSEVATREDLAEFAPARLARERAIALGGVIPPMDTEIGIVPPEPTEK